MPCLEEFNGPDSFSEAASVALRPEGVDLVVIRGLLSPLQAEQMSRRGAPVVNMLYEAVPQLTDTDKAVEEWWQENGYSGYRVSEPRMAKTSSSNVRGGTRAHIDPVILDPPDSGSFLYGPLSLSVNLTESTARFSGERLPMTFKRDDGTFDIGGFWRIFDEVDGSSRNFRTSTVVGQGDGVLFSSQPRPVVHEIKASLKRRAQLFDYVLRGEVELEQAS